MAGYELKLRQVLDRVRGRKQTVRQLVGAGVVCLDAAGQVLLVRRRDNGRWDVPGGRVEVGEEVRAAACRELLEETGLHAREPQLLGVFSGPATLHTYPDGNTVAWVSVLYLCRDFQGVPVAADDAHEVGWFAPGALPQPRSAVVDEYLRSLDATTPL